MRILLTGKNGQLGWELHRLLERPEPVGHFASRERNRLALQGLPEQASRISKQFVSDIDVIALGREDIDFMDTHLLHEQLKRLPEIQLIVNTAAYTDVDKAESHPQETERVNAEAPEILAMEADRRGIPIIHFSSDYVFDGKKWTSPYLETDAPNPLSVYGMSKLSGEIFVRELCEKHLIFRVSSLYGVRRKNFFTTMLRAINAGETPHVVDDQIISPNWIPMIAEAVQHVITMILCGERINWGVYHLSGLGHTTWYEFARMIFERVTKLWGVERRFPVAISSEKYGAPAKRPEYSVLGHNKFAAAFEYSLPNWQDQFLHCVNGMVTKEQ